MSSQFREEVNGRLITESPQPIFGAQEVFQSIHELLGRKWHLIILYHLLDTGPMRFSELKRTIDGISSKMLSESLTDLEEKGLVEREIVQEKPVKIEYSMTDRGRSLEPMLSTVLQWGHNYRLDAPETTANS